MRIAFIGASKTAVSATETLIANGHEVIIVEQDKALVEQLSEELDCSFLNGDGSNPRILQELSPEDTELLFCMSSSDQDNIIASLVGKSLGFSRVVTSIVDTSFLNICMELGLEDTIVPAHTISGYLVDMVSGEENLKLSTITRNQARFFSITIEETKKRDDLELPEGAKVVSFFREDTLHLDVEDTEFEEGDEVVVLATYEAYAEYIEAREKAEEEERKRKDGEEESEAKEGEGEGKELKKD